MRKIFLILSIIATFVSLFSQTISAETWAYGSLHQHTGYSTRNGYDGNPDTDYDDCIPYILELNTVGYTVEELKEDALDLGLNWLAFSDHSYCLDSSEFNAVKSDCENAQDSVFTCLWGEGR